MKWHSEQGLPTCGRPSYTQGRQWRSGGGVQKSGRQCTHIHHSVATARSSRLRMCMGLAVLAAAGEPSNRPATGALFKRTPKCARPRRTCTQTWGDRVMWRCAQAQTPQDWYTWAGLHWGAPRVGAMGHPHPTAQHCYIHHPGKATVGSTQQQQRHATPPTPTQGRQWMAASDACEVMIHTCTGAT